MQTGSPPAGSWRRAAICVLQPRGLAMRQSSMKAITKLEASAKDDWGVSSVSYLKGFNFRMKGHPPKAEEAFRRAYELSPGNTPAAREIAAICLERGNLEEAEIYAREAHSQATSNPYFLDILISVLVRRYGKSAKHSTEIDALFHACPVDTQEH